jgi:two-component system CheB/CheR fusion protein
MEILQFRGSTGPFSRTRNWQGQPEPFQNGATFSGFELRNIIHKARKTSQPAAKSGLEVIVNNKPYTT